MTRVFAVYGKGGIGKSTVVSNLALLCAKRGQRVLLFGCDPKSDSCASLVGGEILTIMDRWMALGDGALTIEECLMQGRGGVHCLEVGGPEPGIGCAGRGITKALELVGNPDELRARYDVIAFDILGDVVCGGFSAPMRQGYAQEIYIVTSGELAALYACNNISLSVKRFARSGVTLGGVIGNLRNVSGEQEVIADFCRRIDAPLVGCIPKDAAVNEAERRRLPVTEYAPSGPAAQAYEALVARLLALGPQDFRVPRPLPRLEFDRLFFHQDAWESPSGA